MSKDQNSTLRIFLSSTAIDMEDHRKKVAEAIQRLDNMPVGMEYFGANPNEPVDVCKSKVLDSDALVVMVAHRYGWVPLTEDGGDEKKSITWIEVETALENNIPVFAFIVDEKFGWIQPKEQDQLYSAKNKEESDAVFNRVKSLQEFKIFLDTKAKLTRDKYTTPEDLALKVTSSLANWILKQSPTKRTTPERIPFVFRIVHHLQPAPHFRGRKKLLDELKQWWQEPVTPDRVRSLVAIGGTGKTAIVERFLDSIKKAKLRGSILVWSFYDEPNTDAFLNEACIVFAGEEPQGAGGKLEKLQRALSKENYQHLFVLDGLERVQSEGIGSLGHAKGDLEDHRIKNLLRTIASGLGNTRALITSRFKLNDLTQFENAGYKSNDLDVLDKETAIEVLRAWEIRGNDNELAKIAESVGRHALSVSVLGSYLNHYCDCEPDGVKEFKLDEISPDEPLAARLGRILGGYAKNLPEHERDLLVRLSVFPKGVSIEILVYLIDAGGEIAGALIGASQRKILTIAEKLKKQGLIYSYKNKDTIVYTAHPFLRNYFRGLIGIKVEDIHEVIRNKLALDLDTKPENMPSDSATLNKYENLIEHSLLAGHYQEAFDIFDNVMRGDGGGNSHLYHKLGDYGRIIRIISLFSEDGTPQTFSLQLSDYDRGVLIHTWGLAALAIGDLKTADFCFISSGDISRKNSNFRNLASSLQSSAWVLIYKGLFPSAKKLFEESLETLKSEDENAEYVKYISRYDFSVLAYTLYSIGEISLAKKYFSKATEILGLPLFSLDGFYETMQLLYIGEKEKAIKRANENMKWCYENDEHDGENRSISYCHYIHGILSLPVYLTEARNHLLKLRMWTEKSGHMECIIYSHILASEIAYCSGDLSAAIFEATTGLNHAESCGYGKHEIDLLLQLSKIQLAIPDYKSALSFARKALDLSARPECGYAWGEANGSHLCGICHKELGEYPLARQRLEKALKIREKIQHPELEETRRLLAELPNQ